jgi:hypothetical protein
MHSDATGSQISKLYMKWPKNLDAPNNLMEQDFVVSCAVSDAMMGFSLPHGDATT